MPPRRISGNDTVPLPRSFLSVSPFSRWRISEMGRVKSRFHSSAFMERSRWASKMSMGVEVGALEGWSVESVEHAVCYIVTWLHGYMVTWLHGYMVTWL